MAQQSEALYTEQHRSLGERPGTGPGLDLHIKSGLGYLTSRSSAGTWKMEVITPSSWAGLKRGWQSVHLPSTSHSPRHALVSSSPLFSSGERGQAEAGDWERGEMPQVQGKAGGVLVGVPSAPYLVLCADGCLSGCLHPFRGVQSAQGKVE